MSHRPTTEVVLARIPETREEDAYEPQRVRVLDNSLAILFINNADRISGDPFNFTVRFATGVQGVRRIGVSTAICQTFATNVNLKNNVFIIVVVSGVDAGTYTITVPRGNYTDVITLGNDMSAAFSAVIPGMTVSGSLTPYESLEITFTDPFYIRPDSPAILYGQDVYGFPPSVEPENPLIGERASLTFSLLYNINSNALTKYQKNRSASSNSKASNTLITFNGYLEPASQYVKYEAFSDVVFKNFQPNTQITEIDIQVRDQWGDDPITYTDSPNTWRMVIDILTYV